MYQINKYDIIGKIMDRSAKENYIANMLVHTLYSNNVNNAECYRIIKLFDKKVLGDTLI